MSVHIAGLQKLTLLDYPGRVACTVFLGGCNLRCPFCHKASLVLPRGATETMTEESFLAFLKKRQGILDGVCVTGGEPLLQPELPRLLSEIKSLGYGCKLDTNGTLPHRLSPLIQAGAIDYIAMDIKSSLWGYNTACGVEVDTEAIKQSIALIKQSGIPHEFRTTVVSGLHTESDIESIAALIGDEPYFLQSFVDSGDLISPTGLSAFSPDQMRAMRDVARRFSPRCEVRGV